MTRFLPVAAMTFLALGTNPSPAVDLTMIDRSIAKEPAYKSKPKYCLLVFGQEAKHRVWVVLDGDVVYIDRNGNGDLTEEGERLEANRYWELHEGEDKARPAVGTAAGIVH